MFYVNYETEVLMIHKTLIFIRTTLFGANCLLKY